MPNRVYLHGKHRYDRPIEKLIAMLRSLIVKKRWWLGTILGCIALALVLVPRMIQPKVTGGLSNEIAMKAAVLRAVPPGSMIAHAKQFMVQEGFQCVRMTNKDFAEQEQVYRHIDYVYCDRRDSVVFPVTRRWQLGLVYEQDRITDVLVSTGLTGP
jgi:hypothetical protein